MTTPAWPLSDWSSFCTDLAVLTLLSACRNQNQIHKQSIIKQEIRTSWASAVAFAALSSSSVTRFFMSGSSSSLNLSRASSTGTSACSLPTSAVQSSRDCLQSSRWVVLRFWMCPLTCKTIVWLVSSYSTLQACEPFFRIPPTPSYPCHGYRRHIS